MKKYVSVDIGGTAIKYGIISEDGIILERGETKTEAQKGGPFVLSKAVEIVRHHSTSTLHTHCQLMVNNVGSSTILDYIQGAAALMLSAPF